MGSPRAGVYVSLILAFIFWGITFVAFKLANESFGPITIVFFRLFVSIFFLFGFALLFKRLMKIQKKDQKLFLLLAIVEPFFYFLGESYGLTMVTATVGAVIIATIPLIAPFAAYIIYKERLTRMNRIGLVVSFGGVLMVILTKNQGLSANPLGILLLFVAVISAVSYSMIVKRLAKDYNPITITAYQSLYGLPMFIPLFLITDLPDLDIGAATTTSILAVTYLGVFGSGICFILFTIGIRELGAAKANIFANLVPVVAAILSFFLLKESMPLLKILGILVAILGLLMSQISGIRMKQSARKDAFRHPPYS